MSLQPPFTGTVDELRALLDALADSGHGRARIGVAFLDGLPTPTPKPNKNKEDRNVP